VMKLPSVSLGIIPLRAGRHGHRPRESFEITDTDLVTIEMLTGFLSLTHADEVAAYATASIAVHGTKARTLITDALAALDDTA